MRALNLILSVMLLCGCGDARTSPSAYRLILSDGHVIQLDKDGVRVHGVPHRLEGFRSIDEQVFSVVADYRYGKLYVTPETSYVDRRTLVFDLSTLRRIAVLPGVTQVIVPKSDDAQNLTTRVFRSDGKTSFSSQSELHQNADEEEIEFRSRAAPSQVLVSSKGDWRLGWSKFDCYSPSLRGFLSPFADQVVDSKLNLVPSTKNKADAQIGTIMGCWPDGTVWRANERTPRTSEVAYSDFSVQSADNVSPMTRSLAHALSPESSYWFELGRSPSALAIIDRLPNASAGAEVGALYSMTVQSAHASIRLPQGLRFESGWFLHPISSSPTHDEWFLTTARYRQGGLRLQTSDQLFVISANTDPVLKAFELPQELLRINQVRRIELDESIDEVQKQRSLKALGEIPEELKMIRSVQLSAVIPN